MTVIYASLGGRARVSLLCNAFEEGVLCQAHDRAFNISVAFSGVETIRLTVLYVLAFVLIGNWGCGVFGGDLQLKSMIQVRTATSST